MRPVYVNGAESRGLCWTDEDSLIRVSTQPNVTPPVDIYMTPNENYLTRQGGQSQYNWICKRDALIMLVRRGEGVKLSLEDIKFIEGAKIQ